MTEVMTKTGYCKCDTCGRYGWFGEKALKFGRHKCSPKWVVRYEDYDRPYYAIDAEGAARQFVEWWDSADGDYPIAGDLNEMDVIVMPASVYGELIEVDESLEHLLTHLAGIEPDEEESQYLQELNQRKIELQSQGRRLKITGCFVPEYTITKAE